MRTSFSRIKSKKVITVTNEGIIAVEGYNFYKRKTGSIEWEKYATISDGVNSLLAILPITRRLTRAEITKHYVLQSGTELAIARKGIFRKEKNCKKFFKSFNVLRGSRPMFLCQDLDGSVYFGEYFQNMEKKPVHIYCSKDDGQTWDIVYTFTDGAINHIHGIYMDPFTQKMWIATGDRENECIIGYTDDGFKTIKEVYHGSQDYRTCVLFFYKDFIVFGTDSQYQQNVLKKFNRRTLEISKIQEIQGPVIRGAQYGEFSIISTDVEPSEVNLDKHAYVWYTKDGQHWQELCKAEKDWLHPMLFQFGVFDLPSYSSDYRGKEIYVTGNAVKECSGDTLVFDIDNL